MKVLLIVPDGVAVRNYLYSSFIVELFKKNAEVIIYHQLSESAITEIKNVHPQLDTFIEIPKFIESPLTRLLRESLAFARILRNIKALKNRTVITFWNRNHKTFKLKALNIVSEFFGFILSKSYQLVLKADHWYEKRILISQVIEKITKDFKSINPDVVLNLHQRSPLTAPIVAVAKKEKIKCSTVIFSWDNIPKARLISRYDSYLVWSDLMKDQLVLLYPEISKHQVLVVGTTQFECYFNQENYLKKELFFKQYGLDPLKRTICFSANDRSSPYDPNYLEDICKVIKEMVENERPQILFRRCPVDKSDRFDTILETYKSFVTPIDPDWRVESHLKTAFASIYPTYNDFVLLVNTVKHCDLVINLGSTMAHDFAILDKPCLYLNYDPIYNSTLPVNTIYNFEHFRSMKGLNAVGWINSKAEILDMILKALNKPNEVGADRKKWMETIVLHPLDKNAINIAKAIL
ncbi:hypothetical protein KO504_00590 [Winogradskyella psychrotolerans]|uniref:hypothetical protein n=1 Tax=Winogradskyella psychrotolerans TaxID=1344585 RepID=UPI001C06F569|nr:hypothetical protein [Winogradskyella psychrotolerans]MBU2919824.1 hypothetical protein [Winogradskyella psychrotolerans]